VSPVLQQSRADGQLLVVVMKSNMSLTLFYVKAKKLSIEFDDPFDSQQSRWSIISKQG
jgi:hypothetical protein